MAWNYPRYYFKPVCDYHSVYKQTGIVQAESSFGRSWSRLCPYDNPNESEAGQWGQRQRVPWSYPCFRGSGHGCARLRSRRCPYYKHTKSRHCERYVCTWNVNLRNSSTVTLPYERYTYTHQVYWCQTLCSHFHPASMCQMKYYEIRPQVCLYHEDQGAVSIRKTVLPGMAIPMLKIRRPNGRLIFNMEIAIRR